jgi:hypothetical protein
MHDDPLAAFEPGVIRAVATDRGFDPETLSRLVRRHQEGVRTLPGVLDLVYEWRRTLPGDPLLARTDAAFVLATPPTVWDEFGSYLDLTARELAALRAVHERQAALTLGDGDGLENASPVVLTR